MCLFWVTDKEPCPRENHASKNNNTQVPVIDNGEVSEKCTLY